jgi:hypothetical protein
MVWKSSLTQLNVVRNSPKMLKKSSDTIEYFENKRHLMGFYKDLLCVCFGILIWPSTEKFKYVKHNRKCFKKNLVSKFQI